jgi:RND family efflux transporter MFP subunit
MKNGIVIRRGSGSVITATAVVLMCMQLLPARCAAQGQETSAAGVPGGKPVRVEVASPVKRPLKQSLNIPATLMSGESADLFAKTSGYVLNMTVDIGDRVKMGDTLLVIDVPEMADELRQVQAVLAAKRAKVLALRAQVTQAESSVATAKANLKRSKAQFKLRKLTRDRMIALWKEKAIPDQKHDEAVSEFDIAEAILDIGQAEVLSAQAELQATRSDVTVGESQVAVEEANVGRLETLMNYATITAPFDGVITARWVDPGAFVRSAAEGTTTPLLTIANVSYIRVVLEIPESDVLFVRKGTEVSVDVKVLGRAPIKATITRTAVALKPNTRTMRAEVELDNSAGNLAPGMYAHVKVTLVAKASAMLVPSKALRVVEGGVAVMVADGRVARSVTITVGYDDGIWAEILKGLSGDEKVIVSSSGGVAPGASVHVVSGSNF